MVKPPLLVATRSLGKQPEIKDILADIPYRCVFPDEVGIYERTEEGKLEDAESFSANAFRKAEYFALRARIPTAADDSGIEVLSLGGKPGVKSKRFAMPSPNQDVANNEELLRRLSGAPREKRKARYRCCVSYLKTPNSIPMNFEGVCSGYILEEPEGDAGFGYDPIFWSDDLEKSFGNATPEEKHAVSHRGRAFRAFAEWLMKQK
ncbi:non-canonical purine NTP pyrophosphatase [Gemmatimonadota bacterium]